jgi:hypothetical protein
MNGHVQLPLPVYFTQDDSVLWYCSRTLTAKEFQPILSRWMSSYFRAALITHNPARRDYLCKGEWVLKNS